MANNIEWNCKKIVIEPCFYNLILNYDTEGYNLFFWIWTKKGRKKEVYLTNEWSDQMLQWN